MFVIIFYTNLGVEKYLSSHDSNWKMKMFVQLPKLDTAESLNDWIQTVANQTDVDEPVVEAIVSEVQDHEAADTTPETPWDSESSGMTYAWPANEHSDF